MAECTASGEEREEEEEEKERERDERRVSEDGYQLTTELKSFSGGKFNAILSKTYKFQ